MKRSDGPPNGRTSLRGRDGVLFAVGIAGIAHEVVATTGERPYLLLALLAMAGFPITQWIDRARQTALRDKSDLDG